MTRSMLVFTAILGLVGGCTQNSTTPKSRNYARKEFYLGHDYFSRHIRASQRISVLLRNLDKAVKRNDIKEISSIRNEIEEERRKADRFLDAALTELSKAVQSDPSMSDAHFELGLIYLKKATQRDDLARRVQCLTGDAAKENSEAVKSLLGTALRHFRLASGNKKLRSRCYNNMSSIYIYLGEYDAAVQAARQALSDLVYREPYVAQANLGWAQYHLKQYGKAVTALRQSLVLEPKFCLARYRLGRVLFDMGSYEEAARQLRRAMKPGSICEAYQEGHQYLALALMRTGSLEKAAKELNICISIAPESCAAQECQNLLQKIR